MVSRYGTELGITDYLNHSREPDLGLDPRDLSLGRKCFRLRDT